MQGVALLWYCTCRLLFCLVVMLGTQCCCTCFPYTALDKKVRFTMEWCVCSSKVHSLLLLLLLLAACHHI